MPGDLQTCETSGRIIIDVLAPMWGLLGPPGGYRYLYAMCRLIVGFRVIGMDMFASPLGLPGGTHVLQLFGGNRGGYGGISRRVLDPLYIRYLILSSKFSKRGVCFIFLLTIRVINPNIIPWAVSRTVYSHTSVIFFSETRRIWLSETPTPP